VDRARLIAVACNALPALLAECRRGREEVARLKAALKSVLDEGLPTPKELATLYLHSAYGEGHDCDSCRRTRARIDFVKKARAALKEPDHA
jgi:hypothetical protein